MLVLSRQKDESIIVFDKTGQEILRLTVVDVRGDKVRLGLTADKELTIHREEVAAAIAKERSSDALQS